MNHKGRVDIGGNKLMTDFLACRFASKRILPFQYGMNHREVAVIKIGCKHPVPDGQIVFRLAGFTPQFPGSFCRLGFIAVTDIAPALMDGCNAGGFPVFGNQSICLLLKPRSKTKFF